MLTRRAYALILALAVLTSACTSVKPFVVTGETLDGTGKLFVSVGTAYNQALDDKAITPEQYRPWGAFAKDFKKAFPLAVQGWHSAVLANNKAAEEKISEAITILATTLAEFGLKLYEMTTKKGA